MGTYDVALTVLKQYMPGLFRVEKEIDRAWEMFKMTGYYVPRQAFREEARAYKELATWQGLVPTLPGNMTVPSEAIDWDGWEGMTSAYQSKVSMLVPHPYTGDLEERFVTVSYTARYTVNEIMEEAVEDLEEYYPEGYTWDPLMRIVSTMHKPGAETWGQGTLTF